MNIKKELKKDLLNQNMTKLNKDKLEMLDCTEIYSLRYEGIVGIKGNKVYRDGEQIDVLNTNKKVSDLFDEHFYFEFGVQ